MADPGTWDPGTTTVDDGTWDTIGTMTSDWATSPRNET